MKHKKKKLHVASTTSPISWLNKEIPDEIQHTLRLVENLLLTLAVFAVFIPLNPVMPSVGLDPSWRLAINQAVSDGLVFGKDLIFTFGPYAAIYTKTYHPCTDFLMLIGSGVLAACYAYMLLSVLRSVEFFWRLLCLVLLAGFTGSRDALLFSYVLLSSLYLYHILTGVQERTSTVKVSLLIFMCFLPFGLLPLIKSSLFILVIPVTGMAVLTLLGFRQYRLTLAVLTAPIAGFLGCWLLVSQPLGAIPDFLLKTSFIMRGYSQAMAYTDQTDLFVFFKQIVFFLFSSALVIFAIFRQQMDVRLKRFLLVTFAIFLFAAFKAGFVRHDNQHALIAGSALLIAAIYLNFIFNGRFHLLLLTIAATACFSIGGLQILNNVYADSRDGWSLRFNTAQPLSETFHQEINHIHQRFPLPTLTGRTDIYSFQQASLLASKNTWSPRPILQSYSSYNTYLSDLDNTYLERANRPNHILFNLETIDHRLPTLDVGRSLITLLNRYSLVDLLNNEYLLFNDEETSGNLSPPDIISSATLKLTDIFYLPRSHDIQYLSLTLTPSLLGRLANAFLNTPAVYLHANLADGSDRTYRLIPSMAESGFMISPLIENNQELAALTGGSQYLLPKQVVSISLSFPQQGSIFWKHTYSLSLQGRDIVSKTNLQKIHLFNESRLISAHSLPVTACNVKLNAINNLAPSQHQSFIPGTLSVYGRAKISTLNGRPTSEIYITLQQSDGSIRLITTHMTPKEELIFDFGNYAYFAYLDTRDLKGLHTIGLATQTNGVLATCLAPAIPLEFDTDAIPRHHTQ